MSRQSSRARIAALALVLAFGLLVLTTRSVVAPRTAISAQDAASRALAAGRDQGLGGYVTPPDRVLGRQMSFDEALHFALGTSAVQDHTRPGVYPVWLVVLEGRFIGHVPAAPPDVPAQDVEHSQMALLIDAETGEVFESVLVSPRQLLDTRSLATLPLPGE